MGYPQGLFFKLLLSNSSSHIEEGKLSLFGIDETKIDFQTISKKNPLALLKMKENLVKETHYSWIEEFLRPLPEAKRKLALEALSENARVGIKKLSGEPIREKNKNPLFQKFCLRLLLSAIPLENVGPTEYLPDSPLNTLLLLSKKELLELISTLGLFDLAEEIKKTVDTKGLKGVYKVLGPRQQLFLRDCIHTKDKLISPSLHLEKWDGEKKSLQKILESRGLARLAIALSGEERDLVFHLSRKLDRGRGKWLEGHTRLDKIPTVTAHASLQVLTTLNFLSRNRP